MHLNVKILRMKKGGDPVALPTDVLLYDIPRTQERFAQCCITVTVTVETVDPPAGVNLKDGLTVWLLPFPSDEEVALYKAYGTPGKLDDIGVFYVNYISDGSLGISYFEGVATGDLVALANNIIISTRDRHIFTLAHEIMHILLNSPDDYNLRKFLLFYPEPTTIANSPVAAKRITEDQCKEMKKNTNLVK